ncbi:GntR family transcriptional regulator [Streptomyces sp. SID6673]|nr:GntR family transcriptional regulator [Streptomyces sp. SID11726]NEB23173.1 GntR family transcriptional regulator [Streptomyces sp. SID6673]NED59562.1 GntR family transcriptional regulator [Streptomyces sp. SID10244]
MSADLATMLTIDHDGAEPPFEQVRAGVIELIARRELLVGERIPTVRRLAADLGLAANTVARSYRELEAAGVIETRGRHGSFIKSSRDATLDRAQQATVEHVRSLRDLGIDDATIVTLVTQATRLG